MNHLQAVKLKEWPAAERPRERMKRLGPQALSQSELLAILLGTGTTSEHVVDLSHRILQTFGGVRGLLDVSPQQLMLVHGLGQAKSLKVLAGIELGRRAGEPSDEEVHMIRSPEDASVLLMDRMRHLKKEHFVCLFLDTKHRVIGQETLSIGSLDTAIVHPREVFKSAIQFSSSSILCAHNHPSGDPTPSREDIDLTKRLADAGELVGIELLDHIIIGDQRFISLKERGLL